MRRSLETLVSWFAIAPPILEIPCGDNRRVDMDDDHMPSSSSGEDMLAHQRKCFEYLNDSFYIESSEETAKIAKYFQL